MGRILIDLSNNLVLSYSQYYQSMNIVSNVIGDTLVTTFPKTIKNIPDDLLEKNYFLPKKIDASEFTLKHDHGLTTHDSYRKNVAILTTECADSLFLNVFLSRCNLVNIDSFDSITIKIIQEELNDYNNGEVVKDGYLCRYADIKKLSINLAAKELTLILNTNYHILQKTQCLYWKFIERLKENPIDTYEKRDEFLSDIKTEFWVNAVI